MKVQDPRYHDPSRPKPRASAPPSPTKAISGAMNLRDSSAWPSLRLCVRRCLWYILAAEVSFTHGEPPMDGASCPSVRLRQEIEPQTIANHRSPYHSTFWTWRALLVQRPARIPSRYRASVPAKRRETPSVSDRFKCNIGTNPRTLLRRCSCLSSLIRTNGYQHTHQCLPARVPAWIPAPDHDEAVVSA